MVSFPSVHLLNLCELFVQSIAFLVQTAYTVIGKVKGVETYGYY